jgi:serine/threonine protein phosphatase PrpC
MKNVVLRALGAVMKPSFDLIRGRGFPQDLFLHCSDGLTDMLDDAVTVDSNGSEECIVESIKSIKTFLHTPSTCLDEEIRC